MLPLALEYPPGDWNGFRVYRPARGGRSCERSGGYRTINRIPLLLLSSLLLSSSSLCPYLSQIVLLFTILILTLISILLFFVFSIFTIWLLDLVIKIFLTIGHDRYHPHHLSVIILIIIILLLLLFLSLSLLLLLLLLSLLLLLLQI